MSLRPPARPPRGATTSSRSRDRDRDRTRRSVEDTALASTVTTARTRIVGSRTGVGADAVVAAVRSGRAVRAGAGRAIAAASSVITPLGASLLLLVPLMLLGGYQWGWSELLVLGIGGAVLAIVALLFLIGRTPLVVTLAPPAPRVAVGDEATASIHVVNRSARRSLSALLDLPVGSGLVPVSMPGLPAGGEARRDIVVPTTRRGRLVIGPVLSVQADPVGLLRREVTWTDAAVIIVHPRTIDIPSTSSGLVRDLEGQPTQQLTPSDLAFHALREYAPGDDRRHIHWKSTAKTGTFMVRQYEQTRRSHLVVALSIASIDFSSDVEFELAVGAAGSLGARAIRDARDISVVVSAVTPDFAKRTVVALRPLATRSPTALLDELSLVEYGPSALGILDVARLSGDGARGISVAFLVVGSSVTPARLRSAAAAFPPAVEVVALQCDPDRIPGRRRLGALTVITIGSLADLRRALRGGGTW